MDRLALMVCQCCRICILLIGIVKGCDGIVHQPMALAQAQILPIPFPAERITSIQFEQRSLNVQGSLLPITLVRWDPTRTDLQLRPIWARSDLLAALKDLEDLAQEQGSISAINGGFFNRNSYQPIGALRRDGEWISSPTLGRGAVVWNDQGEFRFSRLSLTGQAQTDTGIQIPLQGINTALIVAGVSQYTPAWGSHYTTQTDDELLVQVVQDQVAAIYPADRAGTLTVSIPADGYLLTGRNTQGWIEAQPVGIGDQLQITWTADPLDLDEYPHALGAGPLLLQGDQIVLDAELEQFQPGFQTQRAARSAIGQTDQGEILLVTVGQSQEFRGVTLLEMAQVMQDLGCQAALNLDGGTSSTLYLNGTIYGGLNSESRRILPRIHNALGLFPTP